MIRILGVLVLCCVPTIGWAADPPKPNTLTPKEIEEGWIMLFDGETTFGWKTEGDVKVEDGTLVVGGKNKSSITTTSSFQEFELHVDCLVNGKAEWFIDSQAREFPPVKPFVGEWVEMSIKAQQGRVSTSITQKSPANRAAGIGSHEKVVSRAISPIRFEVPAGDTLKLQSIKLKPLEAKPLFNGKDLEGWKVFPGDQYKSKYSVTKEGWLNVKNGPGDLQTNGQYADFLLQIECISNGKALNSGVFFRCIANQYQNGYEAQIHNGYKDNDRTKPTDSGTGAIYRRVLARKVVPNDNEWFTMTVLAQGNHLATWVNGYQTADWTDDRKADNNPRRGSKTEAGHISLQGHDPTTDLSFRNIRIVEFKGEKK